MQKPISNSFNKINNNSDNAAASGVGTTNSQEQINVSQYAFQQKAAKIIDSTSIQKIRVGDIDIAFKQFGKSKDNPIVLITGLGATMDIWSPDPIYQLSQSNNKTVIIFDNRGSGESTKGTKAFSINQFANDTIGLLDALNIKKANIPCWSIGSFVAQEIAFKNPELTILFFMLQVVADLL